MRDERGRVAGRAEVTGYGALSWNKLKTPYISKTYVLSI